MEILVLSSFLAFGYFIILAKILGLKRLLKYRVIADVTLTFGAPFLLIGTFSGMASAIIAGVLFTIGIEFVNATQKVLAA
jgi:hypothetical protein